MKLNVEQEKVIRVLQVDIRQQLYSTYEIRPISRINKTTRTLLRSQKAVPVGTCHDIDDLSYDNDLCNRARLNQSIEFLSWNRKDTTKFKWCEKKFELNVV